MKGAPERVLNKCKYIYRNGKDELVDDEVRRSFKEANKTFAK